jgi:hypothetical protein
MSVEHVEVLVEEPSMEAAMLLLLPGLLNGASFKVYTHQCKDDLLQRLPERLQGYESWFPRNWRIVVIVDRDDDDCCDLKREIETMAARAGLVSRSRSEGKRYAVVSRLAIEELEAWYFGDWEAVRAAYPRVPMHIPSKAPYRDPDGIAGGTWEAFEREMKRVGYFKTGLRKIEAARSIAAHMRPDRNTSRSFKALLNVLREMAPA